MFKVMITRMLTHVRRIDGHENFSKQEKICKKKKKSQTAEKYSIQ